MKLKLRLQTCRWAMREAFVISRGTRTEVLCLQVTVEDANGIVGRGESSGISYAGETPQTMAAQLERHRASIEGGLCRDELLDLLPSGGARCALDAALWDLESKSARRSAFAIAAMIPRPVTTLYTIGIRTLSEYEASAAARRDFPALKVKVGPGNPLAAIRAVKRGAPDARFVVDPNQAWSVAELNAWAPELAELGVDLLEQPVPVADATKLAAYNGPIKLCADELINDASDLPKAAGRFGVVNIKLDKAGGLTAALRLADAAEHAGFELMVGCMAGSSLSIAPALVLAQRCSVVDLDAPLLLAKDRPNGLVYRGANIQPAAPDLWG